jgi:hypothetical protein
VIEEYGKPSGIRTYNGPEFTSHLFQNWLEESKIEWVKIQKVKPQQNAIIERFNRKYREDILDANLFRTLDNVRDLTQTWIEDYNNERPHEALNYQTPENILRKDVEFSTPFHLFSIGLIYSWRVAPQQSSFKLQSNKAKISNLNYIYNLSKLVTAYHTDDDINTIQNKLNNRHSE